MCVYIYIYMYVYRCVYVCMYIYICVYNTIYIHIYWKKINIEKDKIKLINVNNYDQYLGYEITLRSIFSSI